MQSTTEFYRRNAYTYRRNDERVSIILMHFGNGQRWWVSSRPQHRDIGDPNGYELLDDALKAGRNY
jgi:hypothetical protein